jgi:hypothetical protein
MKPETVELPRPVAGRSSDLLGWFICDPRRYLGHPQYYDGIPAIRADGFMWWDLELREVREIHSTKNGRQIELFD